MDRDEQGRLPAEVRWGVGCLVAAAAMIGIVVLVFLIALALQPPTWVQIALGIGLTLGGAVFAWLIATALARKGDKGA